MPLNFVSSRSNPRYFRIGFWYGRLVTMSYSSFPCFLVSHAVMSYRVRCPEAASVRVAECLLALGVGDHERDAESLAPAHDKAYADRAVVA